MRKFASHGRVTPTLRSMIYGMQVRKKPRNTVRIMLGSRTIIPYIPSRRMSPGVPQQYILRGKEMPSAVYWIRAV
jgi:hypothetical protein